MRSILHVDMNNFYASVECLYRPEIRNFPVAVAGDPLNRHGIILAKNMIAKKLGVTTGEAIWEAKLKAPGLVLVPPDYKKYLRFSRMAREIYYEYSDQVEAFGLDENWIDLTHSLQYLNCDPVSIACERRVGRDGECGRVFQQNLRQAGQRHEKGRRHDRNTLRTFPRNCLAAAGE